MVTSDTYAQICLSLARREEDIVLVLNEFELLGETDVDILREGDDLIGSDLVRLVLPHFHAAHYPWLV